MESDTHVFVLKVWREDEARRLGWRGQITHVASSTRQPVLHLGEISLFIGGYIEQLGITPPLRWRIRRWLDRLGRRF